MRRILLDTGVLVSLSRTAEWALFAQSEFGLDDDNTLVSTSVICRGELLALAEKWNWGSGKRDKLEKVFESFPTLGISDSSIIQSYAKISAWTEGKSVEGEIAPPPSPAVPMGQNDIWVAATAHATRSLLLSTDKDFNHLKETWIEFAFVSQAKSSV